MENEATNQTNVAPEVEQTPVQPEEVGGEDVAVNGAEDFTSYEEVSAENDETPPASAVPQNVGGEVAFTTADRSNETRRVFEGDYVVDYVNDDQPMEKIVTEEAQDLEVVQNTESTDGEPLRKRNRG